MRELEKTRRLSSILEEATLSYSKTIHFPKPPVGFKVNQIGPPPISAEQSQENSLAEYKRGKDEATSFYKAEIAKLRSSYADAQAQLLSKLDAKVTEVIGKLDHKLPDLVLGLAERVLGQITLDKESIEQIVRGMVMNFLEKMKNLKSIYVHRIYPY